MAAEYRKWIPRLKEELNIEIEKVPPEKQSPVHQMDHIERVWEKAEKLDSYGDMGIKRHEEFFLSRCETNQEKIEMLEKILGGLECRWDGMSFESVKQDAKDDFDRISTYFRKMYEELGKV